MSYRPWPKKQTIEPREIMPKAIFLIALIGDGVFIGASYVTELAHPSTQFQNEDAAAFEIARKVGGDIFVTVFLIGMVVTRFTAGLSAQSSVGRLLYAVGRDRVLPRRVFGYLHTRFKTPVLNIAMAGLFGLLAIGLDEATSNSFINFGAFTAFTLRQPLGHRPLPASPQRRRTAQPAVVGHRAGPRCCVRPWSPGKPRQGRPNSVCHLACRRYRLSDVSNTKSH